MAERDEFHGDAGATRSGDLSSQESLDLNHANAEISPEANGNVSHERWAQVKALFESTLSRPASERHDFLAGQCGKDGALRLEVESLLSAHEETGEFLEQPFASVNLLSIVTLHSLQKKSSRPARVSERTG